MSGVRRAIGPSAWWLAGAGALIGTVAVWLVTKGNPGNMGLCVACFTRDTMSVFGGDAFNMSGFAYIRPEIIGLVIGSAVSAFGFREWRPRGGSSILLRFMLGLTFMISALIFLGCTVRAWLRFGAGDLNALLGVAGIITGVVIGVFFFKRGFNLGRAKKLEGGASAAGALSVGVFAALLVLALVLASGTSIAGLTVVPQGAEGIPGGSRAPFYISLIAGLAIGVVAQRSRFCTIGGIRDILLVRRWDLFLGIIGLVAAVFVASNLWGTFNLGFEGQPAAHTVHLANFLSMTIAGLTAVLAGGCPLRQMVMSGEGDADAFVFILGMGAGAFVAHYLQIAATPAGIGTPAWIALGVMGVFALGLGLYKSGASA